MSCSGLLCFSDFVCNDLRWSSFVHRPLWLPFKIFFIHESYSNDPQFSSVSQLCPTLCNPMDCNTPGFPVPHQLPEPIQLTSIALVMPASHLILCHPILLLPSIFFSIRVFSNESLFHIRWPKYWSFSFSVSPSNVYSGLISFRIDWFDLSMSFFSTQLSLWSNSHIHT